MPVCMITFRDHHPSHRRAGGLPALTRTGKTGMSGGPSAETRQNSPLGSSFLLHRSPRPRARSGDEVPGHALVHSSVPRPSNNQMGLDQAQCPSSCSTLR